MDGVLYYFGGTYGAITLASIAAATAYYYLSRPTPERPLVPLNNQSPILDASTFSIFITYFNYIFAPI